MLFKSFLSPLTATMDVLWSRGQGQFNDRLCMEASSLYIIPKEHYSEQ